MIDDSLEEILSLYNRSNRVVAEEKNIEPFSQADLANLPADSQLALREILDTAIEEDQYSEQAAIGISNLCINNLYFAKQLNNFLLNPIDLDLQNVGPDNGRVVQDTWIRTQQRGPNKLTTVLSVVKREDISNIKKQLNSFNQSVAEIERERTSQSLFPVVKKKKKGHNNKLSIEMAEKQEKKTTWDDIEELLPSADNTSNENMNNGTDHEPEPQTPYYNTETHDDPENEDEDQEKDSDEEVEEEEFDIETAFPQSKMNQQEIKSLASDIRAQMDEIEGGFKQLTKSVKATSDLDEEYTQAAKVMGTSKEKLSKIVKEGMSHLKDMFDAKKSDESPSFSATSNIPKVNYIDIGIQYGAGLKKDDLNNPELIRGLTSICKNEDDKEFITGMLCGVTLRVNHLEAYTKQMAAQISLLHDTILNIDTTMRSLTETLTIQNITTPIAAAMNTMTGRITRLEQAVVDLGNKSTGPVGSARPVRYQEVKEEVKSTKSFFHNERPNISNLFTKAASYDDGDSDDDFENPFLKPMKGDMTRLHQAIYSDKKFSKANPVMPMADLQKDEPLIPKVIQDKTLSRQQTPTGEIPIPSLFQPTEKMAPQVILREKPLSYTPDTLPAVMRAKKAGIHLDNITSRYTDIKKQLPLKTFNYLVAFLKKQESAGADWEVTKDSILAVFDKVEDSSPIIAQISAIMSSLNTFERGILLCEAIEELLGSRL